MSRCFLMVVEDDDKPIITELRPDRVVEVSCPNGNWIAKNKEYDIEVYEALDEIISHADMMVKRGEATRRSAEHIVEVAERLKNR